MANFLVNLDFGGFRIKINTNIKDQKKSNINHPMIAAYKKSLVIFINYQLYKLQIEKFILNSFFV